MICSQTASCEFWSWAVTKVCTLKYANGGLTVSQGVISGDVNCFVSPPTGNDFEPYQLFFSSKQV